MSVQLYIVIAVLGSSTRNSLPMRPFDRIQIENQWYEKQILWKDNGRPYNLNVHKQTNTLFFSFSVQETYSDNDFQLRSLNLETKETMIIAGIKGGWATAIDQVNDEIYLGGSNGIFKYNMATKVAEFYKENDKNIWSLFYRRHLFYVSYPEQRLFMELDGKFAIVKEFQHFEVDQIYTTKDGAIYFANSTGLYTYYRKKRLTAVINSLITVRQITEDNNGIIYTCTNFGVFSIIQETLMKIADLRNIHGLTFDGNNNFILSDDRQIMRLVKSNRTYEGEDHW